MSDLNLNPKVPGSSQSQTPASRATTSTTSRLRDSCHACAMSKVKCHKEKPSCSRCTRRGITCEYFVTKRPGRKRDKSHHPTNNDCSCDTVNSRQPEVSGGKESWPEVTISTTYPPASDGNIYSTSLDLSPTSPISGSMSGLDFSSSSGIFSGLLMPMEPCMSTSLAEMSNEFDDSFFAAPIDLFDDALDFDFIQGHGDIERVLLADEVNPDPVSLKSLNEPPGTSKSSPSSHNRTLSSTNTSLSSDSTCSCLMQALDLMKKLSSSNSALCVLSNGSDEDTVMSNINPDSNPSAQAVVMDNKQIIEVVDSMLQCSCAEDSYLLTMLSMIVFKVLGRYAEVVRKPHGDGIESGGRLGGSTSPNDQIRQIGSYFGDEGLGRMAAQLILSELHPVQRLVNQLSPRLKARGAGVISKNGRTQGRNRSGADYQFPSLSDGDAKTVPFSSTTMDQMEIDLRKGVSTLSSEIINMLRQS
ncbi:Trypacidin cluster transcription factor [Lachnellula suecica]|uniref:Trypacidin cluster transcription factor n=1 Tax=Lachnellula suecica TaxID=602035 RepID=A0A8T9CG93_9HELO|nr:Trypacidin cluster transcription factor [Lachnellula suecica]